MEVQAAIVASRSLDRSTAFLSVNAGFVALDLDGDLARQIPLAKDLTDNVNYMASNLTGCRPHAPRG